MQRKNKSYSWEKKNDRGLPEHLSHQCSLSLATAFTPQICFHVWVSCWSVSVCGCRVCPLVSSARVCCALLVLVVKKAQQTSRTSPAALLQKYIRATLPFPFLPSFRFGGRTVGRPVWEGAQRTHLGRNNAGQEKKLRTDTIAWTDVWREVCKHL